MSKFTRSLVQTHAEATKLLEKLNHARLVGFDTESSGPLLIDQRDQTKTRDFINVYKSTMTGFSLAFDDHTSYYVPAAHRRGASLGAEDVANLHDALSYVPMVVAHNVKHELHALKRDTYVAGRKRWGWLDTQLIAWLAQEAAPGRSSYGLKALARHHLGLEMSSFNEATKGRSFDELTPEEGLNYAAEDAEAALLLHHKLFPLLRDCEVKALNEVEMPLVHVLARMERTGMMIDSDILDRLNEEYSAVLEPVIEEWAFLTDGVNFNSPKQMQTLFERGIWRPVAGVKRTKTGYSTDAESVEALMRKLPKGSLGEVLAQLRHTAQLYGKVLGTYITKLGGLAGQYPDGRLHGGFHHTGAATGRLSSSYPNLQNIPARTDIGKQVLRAFVAPEGFKLMSADQSQIELRVMAHLAGGSLKDEYLSGEDVHQSTADSLGIERADGKTVNFAILYGAREGRISSLLGCSRREAKRILGGFWRKRPAIEKWLATNEAKSRARGYVATLGGRKRTLRGIEQFKIGRVCGNTPIQGSARDIVSAAMVAIQDRFDAEMPGEAFICCQVHDDIMSYVSDRAAEEAMLLVKDTMETAFPIDVPLVVEPSVADSWYELKTA